MMMWVCGDTCILIALSAERVESGSTLLCASIYY